MRVQEVAIRPSEASVKAGRPALTPELLAATGARYSRNNEGLESILAKIDPNDLEKSVDSIFRMVDYGHQSIADMVPVAMFIDGVSIWLAYYVWTLCPTAGGQESSTRYLRISPEGLVSPAELGLPEELLPEWRRCMVAAFEAYEAALALWEGLASANPTLMGIPQALLADPADAARKKVARLKRNYAFDRARYFLPVAAATNVMLIMSARGWVSLCQNLLSHPLAEARELGTKIREELKASAPRMLKHAQNTEPVAKALEQEFKSWVALASRAQAMSALEQDEPAAVPAMSFLPPHDLSSEEVAQDLAFHRNRYAPVGSSLQRTSVRFSWSRIGFAEIRDLNRHRTGTKYSPQVPRGFYFALEQLPQGAADLEHLRAKLLQLSQVGRELNARALGLLARSQPTYIYWTLLGTEYPFEHLTTADKFIYEAELRTGLGAHYRYAKHLREALALFYARFPSSKGLILEGSAEPE